MQKLEPAKLPAELKAQQNMKFNCYKPKLRSENRKVRVLSVVKVVHSKAVVIIKCHHNLKKLILSQP